MMRRVLVLVLALAPLHGEKITAHLAVIPGPVNGVLVESAGKHLAIYGDPRDQGAGAEQVLFTHHRREVVWAGRRAAKAIVPAAEKALFTDVGQFWEKFATSRFHDYSQQSSKVLTDPMAVSRTVRGGDRIDWEGVSIEVLDTPGYTRGAVSYLLEIDGKRIACVGDLIYGDGQILDLYSLQDAIPETKEDGYHGWAARAGDVLRSLDKVAAWKPDLMIPAHGPVINNPPLAIQNLTQRLRATFRSHFAIGALRWYRGDEKIRTQAARVLGGQPIEWMPMAETMHDKPPEWIIPISNSRLIVSRSGAAFLVDCGSAGIIQEIERLQKQGVFRTLDGIWVTHYHDDHSDHVQVMAGKFHCPVYACREMRDILENPKAYRMPCTTPNPIRSLTVTTDGEKRRWNEFAFTHTYFPGQTLYHGALLVERDKDNNDAHDETGKVLFVGDSFTPTGIDDYCLLNRNYLDPEKGFLYCLNMLKGMKPDYLLINQHVLPTFRFSSHQIGLMMDNVRSRREVLRALIPWDDPGFGIDEQWARFYPYGSEMAAGRRGELAVIIRNHSAVKQTFRVTPHAPAGWTAPSRPLTVTVGARQDGTVTIPITPAAGARGTAVVTADVSFGRWDMREWAEAMVTLK